METLIDHPMSSGVIAGYGRTELLRRTAAEERWGLGL